MEQIITRFAPSPTGMLHLGGARTALFNYLFAKSQKGKFLLRIEDTDKLRSSKEALESILDGLKWLGLSWDDEIVFQGQNAARHREVANLLLAQGDAYYCFKEEKRSKSSDVKDSAKPTIRLKIQSEGQTTIDDLVQGKVTVANSELEDVVLIKSDGNPTYMLACVCDDHDMQISHVIRGVDHLTNSFVQAQLYKAMGWKIPYMAHIPLIHGPDGQKLSKRHGATGLLEYREGGYLPAALCNYLAKLGWNCGDKEIFSVEEMAKVFHVKNVNKSPARLDFAKLQNLNAQYIKLASDDLLCSRAIDALKTKGHKVTKSSEELIRSAMPALKLRATTLKTLEQSTLFLLTEEKLHYSREAIAKLQASTKLMISMLACFEELPDFSKDKLQTAVSELAIKFDLEAKDIMALLRAAVVGEMQSAGIVEITSILGKENTLQRIKEGLLLTQTTQDATAQ
jgi:glutamyl-tRNA synthetase